MPKDTRNRIHIYWKTDKEHHKVVYPKSILGNKVDWRQFGIDMAYDLYNTMWTEVCHYFNVLVPDDLPYRIQVCWDTICKFTNMYGLYESKLDIRPEKGWFERR